MGNANSTVEHKRTIPVWPDLQPVKSWISIYSHMLSPENVKLRDSIFTYYYCQYLFRVTKWNTKIKNNLDYSKIIKTLTYAISRFDLMFEIEYRSKCSHVSGVIMRLLYSMHVYKIKPSLNKARFIFINYLKDEEVNDYNISRCGMMKYTSVHFDVLHICAASTILHPLIGKITRRKNDNMENFIKISSMFKDVGINLTRDTKKNDEWPPLINPETAFVFASDLTREYSRNIDNICYHKGLFGVLDYYTYKRRFDRLPEAVEFCKQYREMLAKS